MTIEQDNGFEAQLVSKSYQALSSERAPAAINKQILDLAQSESGRNNTVQSVMTAWTKPLAWAATIGLSLAIVLDISKLTDGPVSVSSPAAESIRDEFAPKNNNVIDEAREQAKLRAGSSGQTALPSAEPEAVQEIQAQSSNLSAHSLQQQKKAPERSSNCDEPSRETVTGWLTCIERLRLAGLEEAANREYDELKSIYPDK